MLKAWIVPLIALALVAMLPAQGNAYVTCYSHWDHTDTSVEVWMDCEVIGAHGVVQTCRFFCDIQYFETLCYEDEGFGGMCHEIFPTEIRVNCENADANCPESIVRCPDPNGVAESERCEESCELCEAYL